MADRYIVIAVDFTPPSLDALRWAVAHLGAGTVLVPAHVICVPEPPRFLRGFQPPTEQLIENARLGAEQRLRDLCASLAPAPLRPEIRVGRPETELPRLAAELGAELLVIGAHAERPGVWQLLGSTAERVVRGASHSVLLARGLPAGGVRTILVALDESEVTSSSLAWAARLAAGTRAEVIALHVVSRMLMGAMAVAASEPEWRRAQRQLREHADAWLREQLDAAGLPAAKTEVALGDPGLEILSATVRFGADLLVIGRHGARAGAGAFLGSVAEFLLRNGRESVLVVTEGSCP